MDMKPISRTEMYREVYGIDFKQMIDRMRRKIDAPVTDERFKLTDKQSYILIAISELKTSFKPEFNRVLKLYPKAHFMITEVQTMNGTYYVSYAVLTDHIKAFRLPFPSVTPL